MKANEESNLLWDVIFELLHLFWFGIEPLDMREYSKEGNIREYFKNKYTITKRN